MNPKNFATIAAAAVASFCLSAFAADPGASADPPLTKSEAKDLKAKSDAQYKARKNVAEANEDLAKGDCKVALEGSAKRACDKSAKAEAKSGKADAKTLHEMEKQTIKDSTAK